MVRDSMHAILEGLRSLSVLERGPVDEISDVFSVGGVKFNILIQENGFVSVTAKSISTSHWARSLDHGKTFQIIDSHRNNIVRQDYRTRSFEWEYDEESDSEHPEFTWTEIGNVILDWNKKIGYRS